MTRLALFVPLVLFVVLSVILLLGLDKNPQDLPSALIGAPFPEFYLPALDDAQQVVSREDFKDQVLLVNVWATWCFACRIEHPMLNQFADQGVAIVGINYKDQDAKAQSWLE